MKRIAIIAAMGLLLTFNMSTAQDYPGSVTGEFDQVQGLSNLQHSLNNVNDAQRNAIVGSIQSVIDQLQSQSAGSIQTGATYADSYGAAVAVPMAAAPVDYGYAAPVAVAPVYQAPVYQAPVYQAPSYQASVIEAPVYQAPIAAAPAPVYFPPAPAPPVNVNLNVTTPPAPMPQPQSFVEYGPVFTVPAPQPQTVLVPVIVPVQQQQQRRHHGCRLFNH